MDIHVWVLYISNLIDQKELMDITDLYISVSCQHGDITHDSSATTNKVIRERKDTLNLIDSRAAGLACQPYPTLDFFLSQP